MSVEPQYGQRKPAAAAARARLSTRRAAPAARSRTRAASRGPPGVIRSVDHESSSDDLHVRLAAERAHLVGHRVAHHLERRAAEERRRELDAHAVALDGDVAHDAEVDERDDGISGSGISASASQTAASRHHVAPGTLRRTIVISSHSSRSSSEWPPRSTGVDCTGRPTRSASAARSSSAQHAERVRPQLVDRLLEPRLAAQAVDPHLRVQAVVDLLAVHLRGEPRDLRVVGLLQRGEPDLVRGLVEPVPRDRVRPVQPAQLDERRARGTPTGRGRTRARRPSCRGRARRARTARARGRSRSARSTRTRRPPRATARCPSTPSRASRGSARRRRAQAAAVPARSRASLSFAFSE